MTTAAINHPVADATTSAFDQVKHGIINAANWIGRQVTWLASSIKDIAMRIVEAVKPAFASLVQFVREQSTKVKDFIVANQAVAIPLAIAIPLVAGITLLGFKLFCGEEKAPAAPAATTPATPATPATPVVDAKK